MRRKDLCGSMRAVYVLERLLDVSGPGLVEAGRYRFPLFIVWLSILNLVINFSTHLGPVK